MASKIQVNSVESFDPIGPVELKYGAIIPSEKSITAPQGLTISGIVTATSFIGSGSGLINTFISNESKATAISLVF